MRGRVRALAVVTVVVLTLGFVTACGDDDGFDVSDAGEGDADLSFVIPAGAGEAIDAGAPLEILPARLDVSIGEVIEIVNDDDRGHVIGPFFVGAGETLRQEFASAGEYVGECSVHPSGQIVVDVS